MSTPSATIRCAASRAVSRISRPGAVIDPISERCRQLTAPIRPDPPAPARGRWETRDSDRGASRRGRSSCSAGSPSGERRPCPPKCRRSSRPRRAKSRRLLPRKAEPALDTSGHKLLEQAPLNLELRIRVAYLWPWLSCPLPPTIPHGKPSPTHYPLHFSDCILGTLAAFSTDNASSTCSQDLLGFDDSPPVNNSSIGDAAFLVTHPVIKFRQNENRRPFGRIEVVAHFCVECS